MNQKLIGIRAVVVGFSIVIGACGDDAGLGPDAPSAAAQSITTDEDTAATISLAAIDTDSDSLTYSIVEEPTRGTLTGTAPNLTYTPAADYHGPDSFTFRANDGSADSNTATVSITVAAVNDTPVASTQPITTAEDAPATISLAATDVDGDTLTYSVVTDPTNGTLTGTAPNLTYTPNGNHNGPDSFTFRANDGSVDSNTATVSITVTGVNDAPVAAAQLITTDEDVAASISLAATDTDGDTLTYSVVTGPTNGILSGTAPNVTYTPNGNYNGPDSFTFRANDGAADSNTATVSITVTAVNDPTLSITTPVQQNRVVAVSGAALSLLVTNDAGSAVNATGITVSSQTACPNLTVDDSNCLSVPPGASCTLLLTSNTPYAPCTITLRGINTANSPQTLIAFSYLGGLVFQDNAGGGGKVVIDVTQGFDSPWTSAFPNLVGATSLEDGAANTNAIVTAAVCLADAANCAAQRCRNIGADWYLPARNELAAVHSSLCSKGTLPCDFGGFSSAFYWSSSQFDEFNARNVSFPSGVLSNANKAASASVRCVRAFTP